MNWKNWLGVIMIAGPFVVTGVWLFVRAVINDWATSLLGVSCFGLVAIYVITGFRLMGLLERPE